MFNIYRSNHRERLVDSLADILARPAGPPLEPEWIVVPSIPMRIWLGMELSRRFGVWAGAEMPFPRALIEYILKITLGDQHAVSRNLNEEYLLFAIMARLPELLDRKSFEPLAHYLDNDTNGIKLFQLSRKIAHTFDEYSIYRPEMVLGWEEEKTNSWQSLLWNETVSQLGSTHIARGAQLFFGAMNAGRLDSADLPRRINLFGISQLPPLFMRIIAAIGELTEVNLFAFSPSNEFWGHIHSKRTSSQDHLRGEQLDGALFPDEGHPLLAALGHLGRDFQLLTEEIGAYYEPDESLYKDPLSNAPRDLLHTIQSDILHLGNRRADADLPNEQPAAVASDDSSLQIHSCHSPLREIEVLADQIRALMDDESLDLQPEDILVAAPRIEDYAPYIDAVFGGAVDDVAVPYRIANVETHREIELKSAFFRLIDLSRSRVTLSDVFDLARLDPVRARFELEGTDLDLARIWFEEAGVRYGIDAAHRATCGLPEFDENTWSFGLKRLLLGYAIPEEEEYIIGDTLPGGDAEGTQAAVLGKFASYLDALFDWVRRLSTPRRATEWSELLRAMIDGMFAPSRASATQMKHLREGLKDLRSFAERAAFNKPVGIELIRSFLAAHLETGQSRAHLTGGVLFSSMLPMRGLPFKVVCLVGMNEQDFPRSRSRPSFDVIAEKPRLGDRSVRSDDRYLFLEALLSARERFMLTYTGQDIQDGSAILPSVLVSELLESIDRGFFVELGDNAAEDQRRGPASSRVVVNHPLQPFSHRYFGGGKDRRLFSYLEENLTGARAIREERRKTGPFLTAPIPLSVDREHVVTLEELVRFFKSPCRYLLQESLGVFLEDAAEPVPDREPFALTPLEEYLYGSGLVERQLHGEEAEHLFELMKAQGVLPLGVAGRVQFDKLRGDVDSLLGSARAEREGEPLPSLEIDLALEADGSPIRLEGTMGGVQPHALVRLRFGQLRPRPLFELWIGHLVLNACAASAYPKRSVLLGKKDRRGVGKVAFRPVEEDPRALLADLVRVYRIGRSQPLPLFLGASFAYAKALHGDADAISEHRALAKARAEWLSSHDRIDPNVRRVFGTIDPLGDAGFESGLGFRTLSRRVLSPLVKHLEQL